VVPEEVEDLEVLVEDDELEPEALPLDVLVLGEGQLLLLLQVVRLTQNVQFVETLDMLEKHPDYLRLVIADS